MIAEFLLKTIHEGIEQEDIEFKSSIDFDTRLGRAKIARSISALANTVSYEGYYIVGVIDEKSRKSKLPEDYISGFNMSDIGEVSVNIKKHCLDFFLNQNPDIEIKINNYPDTDKKILIIVVKNPFTRPYSFKREIGDIKSGVAFIRRGASCEVAGTDDIVKMILPKNNTAVSGGVVDALQSIIDEKEKRYYQIEDLLTSGNAGSVDKIELRIRMTEIYNEKLHLENFQFYLKERVRFQKRKKISKEKSCKHCS